MRSLFGVAFREDEARHQQDCEQQAHEQLILADLVRCITLPRFSCCKVSQTERDYLAMLRAAALPRFLLLLIAVTPLAAFSQSPELKKRAQAGDAQAQTELGLAY